MNLEVEISKQATERLEHKAHAAGTDQSALAARLIEDIAARELHANGDSVQQRLATFDRWIASLRSRPGPPVDASREHIYD